MTTNIRKTNPLPRNRKMVADIIGDIAYDASAMTDYIDKMVYSPRRETQDNHRAAIKAHNKLLEVIEIIKLLDA